MMDEIMSYIPRQRIKAGEKHICHECFHYAVCMGRVNRPCIECDNYVPAANVRENVKSKWEDVEITMITEDNAPSEIVSMFCPNCKRYHNEVYHYGNPIENANFCPRCGADMTGGNDG